MNKIAVDGIIVVEGKQDVSYLSSFIDSLFFTTNGCDINEEKISFLERASACNKILILTDPDTTGDNIRNTINKRIKGCFDIKISGNSRDNYLKHGVAEANMIEIKKMLNSHIVPSFHKNVYNLNSYFMNEKSGLGFKEALINKYRLICSNTKSLENQLNMLKITPEEIDEMWRDFINVN